MQLTQKRLNQQELAKRLFVLLHHLKTNKCKSQNNVQNMNYLVIR